MTPGFANSAWVMGPERFLLRQGGWRKRRLRVRFGLFVHPTAGPVLIDTGYTSRSLTAPGRGLLLRSYSRMLAPELNPAEQPEQILSKNQLSLPAVTTVIVTHFHADHISGLADVLNARFIGNGQAWARLQSASEFRSARHGVFPELLPGDFGERLDAIEEKPFASIAGLPGGYDLFGDGTVLGVPLPGHADGHFGVLFPNTDPPMLYATDTQWLVEALPRARRPQLLPRLLSDEYSKVAESSDLVETFRRSGGHVVLCHDDLPTPYDFSEGALL